MKKASLSFLVFVFAMALFTTQSFAQGRYNPPQPQYRQVKEGSLITVQVHQRIVNQERIHIGQLIRHQLGLTIKGAEIDKLIVEGKSLERQGRPATVALLLNGDQEGHQDALDPYVDRNVIQIQTRELVDESLQLLVRGDAKIETISIRVGRVRPLRFL